MKANFYLIIGLLAALTSSCSTTRQSLKEPRAIIRYDKAEFNYSPQVVGEASVTKILGVDWEHLLNNKQGIVIPASTYSIYGLLPQSRVEQLALYEIMTNNPGFDFIVYPQYTKQTEAPGLGLFYKKINITAKARLAQANEIIVPKGNSAANARKNAELKNNLRDLQSSYDALLLDVKKIKADCQEQNIAYENALKAAHDDVLEANKKAYNKALERDLEQALDEHLEATPATTAVTTAPTQTAESSSNKQLENSQVKSTNLPPASSAYIKPSAKAKEAPMPKAESGSYMLVIGSYSTIANAEKAQKASSQKYASFNRKIGIIEVSGKYRIGFIDFKSRDEAINFRTRIKQQHPECKDAWPFQP